MRNKKMFNNIFDSICITIFLFILLTSYLLLIWFGVINHNNGTNPVATLIVSTVFFGVMIIMTVIIIVKGCYEYWIVSEKYICSKKIFRKKNVIKFDEIVSVEKKIVPAFVLGIYKSEAYIICSQINKIVILNNKRKRFSDLDLILGKFISE